MDTTRERLIGRHNRITTNQSGLCRTLLGFAIMIAITVSLLITGLVLTGQAKTAAQILSSHKQCKSSVQIIAHRGASGMRPAHSIAGYELAIEQGADFIECDLALTKDGVLVCLHDAYLSSVTNVASIEDFADRKRTADYNGEVDIEDWWVTDFTLEELLELRLVQQFEFRDQAFNNLYTIPTFEEYCQLAQDKNVGIYPETKTPKWFKDELPEFTMEDLMIETISKFEFESEHVILQSFSTQSLLYLSQELKTDLRLIQLANRPITDDELKQLKMLGAYGIGPDKALIIERDDTNHRTGYSDLVKRAHEHNLKVHVYVSRNENQFLLFDYGADVHQEYEDLIVNAGVDGIFTDFTHSLFNYLAIKENTCVL